MRLEKKCYSDRGPKPLYGRSCDSSLFREMDHGTLEIVHRKHFHSAADVKYMLPKEGWKLLAGNHGDELC